MELRFQTKDESNQLQQDGFLKLSKSERAWRFFTLVEQLSKFPTKHKEDKSSHFNIVIQLNEK